MIEKEFDIKEEYDFSDGENIKEFENGKYFNIAIIKQNDKILF